VLSAERVRLAPLTSNDLPLLFAWINDRDQVLFNAGYAPVHELSHASWFEALQQRKDCIIFGIRRIDDDALIGSCQLLNINPRHQNAELQIRLGDVESRGQGLGSEALRLLLRFGFRDVNLHRIYLHVFADNERARRLYEKAGMREEGLLREAAFIDGRFVDLRVMAMLRSEASLGGSG
jgi:RimJ/RimL family protein N-acetyltransferase